MNGPGARGLGHSDPPWFSPGSGVASPLGQVTEIARNIQHRPTPRRGWRRLGRFALVLVLDGLGDYADEEGMARRLGPGELILVEPQRGHRYGPLLGETWQTAFVVFDGAVFHQWSEAGALAALRPLSRPPDPWQWYRRIRALAVERDRAAPTEAAALAELCRVQQLLADLLLSLDERDPERAWLARACALLRDPSQAQRPMAAIAAELAVAEPTLRRRLARHLGTSPHRLRSQARIDAACGLMLTTDLSDRAIAEELAFNDPVHFSKMFKRLQGCSPSVYRRRIGGHAGD